MSGRVEENNLVEDDLMDPIEQGSQESGLRNIIRILRKRRIWILTSVASVLALTIAVSLVLRPIYHSTVTLEILPEGTEGLGSDLISGAVSNLIGGDQLKPEVETQVHILRSNAVPLDVIKTLNLTDRVPFKYTPGFFPNKLILAERGLPIDQAPATRERLIKIFEQNIKVEEIPNTRLITVTVSNPDPTLAAEIANALVKSMIKNHLQVRYNTMLDTQTWMTSQLSGLRERVDQTSKALADFEKQAGLYGVPQQLTSTSRNAGSANGSGGMMAHSPVLDKFSALNDEVTQAEAARIAKEAVYKLTQTQNPDVVIGLGSSSLGALAGFTQGPQGESLLLLQNLRQQEAALKIQLADLTTKYGAGNPRLASMQNQVGQLDKQMLEEMGRISERAKNDYQLARATEEGLQKSFREQERQAVQVNSDAIRAQVLAEEASSTQTLYEELYARLQEASVAVGLRGTNIDVIDPALVPSKPTWPNWPFNIALGILGGLFFGVASAIIKDNMDDSVSTPEDVETITGRPVFGSIPDFALSEKKGRYGYGGRGKKVVDVPKEMAESVIWTLRDPKSVIAEAYRALRTSFLLSRPLGSIQVVAITSSAAAEGKSTTSVNLAATLAQGGKSVLLVDADMRRPKVHVSLQLPQRPGLSNILSGGTPYTEVVRKYSHVAGLDIITAGNIPPTPAELLGSSEFSALLEEWKKVYDIVLIDTPPILHVADAAIIGSQSDMLLVIARSGSTGRRMLRRAVQILQRQCKQAFIGAVVNQLDVTSADYYYTYGYYGPQEYYGGNDATQ